MRTNLRTQAGFLSGLLDSRLAAVFCAALFFSLWYLHYLYPFLGEPLMASGDVSVHVRFVHSASRALAEGQLPIQFANDSSLLLQPIFLYYTPVFYTLAGGLELLGLTASDALLATVGLFALVAQAGLWLLLRELGCSRLVAALAFGGFATAPYFITCLYARSAIAELSFFCLLPVVIHAVLLQSRRDDYAAWLYLSLSTGLLILSHKIFTGWLFMALGLVHLARTGWDVRRNGLFLAAMVGAMAMGAPYWLNAWLNAENLDIAKRNIDAYTQHVGALHNAAYDGPPNRLGILWSFLTSGWAVFSPLPLTHPLSTTSNLHLQIGPLLSVGCLMAAWLGRHNRRLWVITAFVLGSILLACSFWDLFPFWRYLPGPLRVIQFPYRMLTFTVLAGCVLLACVADDLLARGKYAALAILAAVGVFQLVKFDWRPGLSTQDSRAVESTDLVHKDYWEPGAAPVPEGSVSDGRTLGTVFPGKDRMELTFHRPATAGWIALPVVCSRNLTILVDGQPGRPYQQEKGLVVRVPEGARRIVVERREWLSVGSGLAIWLAGLAGVYLAGFRVKGLLPKRVS
jgi:hypothetical protein